MFKSFVILTIKFTKVTHFNNKTTAIASWFLRMKLTVLEVFDPASSNLF